MFYKMFTNKITYPKTTINNEDMKNVINFDYLSAIVNNSGGCSKEVRK